MEPQEIRQAVADVIRNIRERGDAALLEYTRRWDRADLTPATLRVDPTRLATAPPETAFVEAFRRAVERIRRFHARVRPETQLVEDDDGVVLGMRWTPVRSVGLYVPGGRASYPSTLAMTAIPAQIAGVERIVVVSPPGPDGEVTPEVLMAAQVLGLGEVYRIGGAQAIAALALGTQTVPRVDKIFGPGNAFVAEAKMQLFGEVGIDLVAGPSEVVVYADESARPDWVAADLMAQAEHDVDTRVTFLATSRTLLDDVRAVLERRMADEPRREIIEESLRRSGRFEVVDDEVAAARRVDEIAPEHLTVQVREPWRFLPLVRNAGAIYLGHESVVAMGDYYLGPNHVLPTGATARFASCLSVMDYMKRSNVAALPPDFVRLHGRDVETLASGEGLHAHATSVRLRRTGAGSLRSRPGVRAVTPYVLVEEEAEVKLNQNESPWDVPGDIKDEVMRRVRDLPWNRYHQTAPARLLDALAAGSGVDRDGVIAASGSNLLLQWIFEAYGGVGRAALYPWPSFSLYPLWAGVSETRAVEAPLTPELEVDVPALLQRIRDEAPSLVVLCLPNNPTGCELATDRVREVASAAAEVGALLVVDEAYREFSDPAFDRTHLVREMDNVLLVRTCSKAFAAAGMRLGYLLAPPPIAEELRKVVPPFHVGLFTAVLGTVLFEREAVFRERVDEIVAERDRLRSELDGLPGVRTVPSQANFFMFRVASAENVFEALRGRGVLLRRPGGDPVLGDCLRVSVGTPDENRRLVAELRRALA